MTFFGGGILFAEPFKKDPTKVYRRKVFGITHHIGVTKKAQRLSR